mmetsp:Transcript_28143/g.54236  ORF Transcript_28143/g.54236 Transcript_28143/m.54236 type:complete len:435 (-) Transcript_28143:20-1324(-)
MRRRRAGPGPVPLPVEAALLASRAQPSQASTSASNAPAPPPGCSERELNTALRSIRWRLEEAAGGRLRHPRREAAQLVELIRRVTEWLVWGEHHDVSLFDLFCEHAMLPAFVGALRTRTSPAIVRTQVLQSLSIIAQNVRRPTSMIYLLSGGFLNAFFDDPPDLDDEEMLPYFVTLLKGLTLRLDADTAQLCLVQIPPTLQENDVTGARTPLQRVPVLERAICLVGHCDPMVRTAAQTATLHMLQLGGLPEVQTAVQEVCAARLAPQLAASVAGGGCHGSTEELLAFVADLCSLGVPAITTALKQHGLDVAATSCEPGRQARQSDVSAGSVAAAPSPLAELEAALRRRSGAHFATNPNSWALKIPSTAAWLLPTRCRRRWQRRGVAQGPQHTVVTMRALTTSPWMRLLRRWPPRGVFHLALPRAKGRASEVDDG